MEYLDAMEKREWTTAWQTAVMQRMDHKKFPKRPEQIWNPDAPDQTIDHMKTLALAWASNGPEIMKKMKQS